MPEQTTVATAEATSLRIHRTRTLTDQRLITIIGVQIDPTRSDNQNTRAIRTGITTTSHTDRTTTHAIHSAMAGKWDGAIGAMAADSTNAPAGH